MEKYIRGKDIADITKKRPGDITYMKQNKPELFEAVKIGALIKEAGLNIEDTVQIITMYKNLKTSS